MNVPCVEGVTTLNLRRLGMDFAPDGAPFSDCAPQADVVNSSGWLENLGPGAYKSATGRCPSGDKNVSAATNHWCESVYAAKAGHLLLYGRALGLSHSEAEDVLQETFSAFLQMDEPPAEPEHYCVRSFRNRALNFRRSLWRRLTRELESRRWFERGPGESLLERAAMRCLAELPSVQREVIVLKIWHGHTFEAIGALQGVSPNTAAGRYRYGMQKLKVCLQENEYERLELAGEPMPVLDAAPTIGPS